MGEIYSEKWLLAAFWKILGAYSPKQLVLILVLIKKQLINLFDLDVEMNPITLQVKLLFLVECLLNLLRGISSGYGL